MFKFWKSFAWALFILAGLLIPGEHLPKSRLLEQVYVDKIIHFGLFWMMEFLLLAEGMKAGVHKLKVYMIFSSIAIVFALLTEWLQHFPWSGRDMSVYDFMADALGIIAAGVTFRLMGDLKFLSFLRRL